MHVPAFRVFYSTTFTVLLLILLGLLLVTPADAIFQSYVNNQLYNAIIVAGVYVAAFFVAGFIYATRIYTTRQHLAAIPRLLRAPVRKGDAGPAVRRMIEEGLLRSASIAWNAHPKSRREEADEVEGVYGAGGVARTTKSALSQTARLPWGVVQHSGWSSPDSRDLPGVQFTPVVAELVHLLEAKAVTLAPADPLATAGEDSVLVDQDGGERTAVHGEERTRKQDTGDAASLPDAHTVSLLQRPAAMGARQYVFRLMDLGMLSDVDLATSFLAQYEHARFSGAALAESSFRDLMRTFATLLSSLAVPDPAAVEAMRTSSGTSTPKLSTLRSQPSLRSASLRSASQASSVLHRLTTDESRLSESRSETQGGLRPTVDQRGSSHLTPFFTPRPGSLSSNDGDHDSDSSGHTTHTEQDKSGSGRAGGQSGFLSAGRKDGARSVSRTSRQPSRQNSYLTTPRAGSTYTTPMLESRHSSREDLDAPSDEGSEESVVRRVPTNASGVTSGSWTSEKSGGSVVRREVTRDRRGDYFGTWIR